MRKTHHWLLLIVLLLGLLPVAAQEKAPDTTVVGNWVSSTGARVKIDYAPEDTTQAVHLSINGGKPIRATLTPDRHNTIKIEYVLSDGTSMSGHYQGGEDVIRILDQGRLFATWKRQR